MFPISLNLHNKQVIMFGAGRVGQRKLIKLITAGARIRVVEPHPGEEVKELARNGAIELFASLSPDLFEGVSLAFAATGHPELNQDLAREAQARGIWVNVADAPELSDFFLPAVLEQGCIQLTVATGGSSPALSAKIAEELRTRYGPEYGRLAVLMAELRPMILSSGLDGQARNETFKRLIDSKKLLQALARHDQKELLALLTEILKPIRLPSGFNPSAGKTGPDS